MIANTATTLVAARVRGGHALPLIVAGRHGKGMLLVFGHGGYLDKAHLKKHDSSQLILNFLTWSQQGREDRIGLVGHGGVRTFLDSKAYLTQAIGRAGWHHALASHSTIVIGQGDVKNTAQARALVSWVAGGGRLITSGLIWGWRQLNSRKKAARDHLLNQALAPMGVFLAGGTIQKVIQPGSATADLLEACSARSALLALAQAREEKGDSTSHLQQAGQALASAVRWIPDGQEGFVDEVRRLLASSATRAVPTKQQPLTTSHVFDRLALTVEHLLSLRSPPKKIRSAASAGNFPGQPHPEEKAVTRTMEINPPRPGWHGLGLYARAGSLVTVTIPKELVAKGLRLRIGSHKDELWSKAKWMRHPEVSRSWPIDGSEQQFASPHGGLVYVELPRRSDIKPFPVTLRGAVPALRFVLGKTTPEQWRQDAAKLTAPWAELECDLVTLTVKRESAAQLDDPTELMAFWNEAIKLYAVLGQRSLDRRPQRFVSDRQISAGWLHSGYPIMMQLVHSDMIVDLTQLRDAPKNKSFAWGFWHELGHNHQRPSWTFRGTTEVTCNLFSLFIDDKVRGVKPAAHPWPRGSRRLVGPFIEKDRSFARWKKKPGLALWTYILIQDEFGWEPFQKAFASYQKGPRNLWPRNDAEKRDQFMVRMSLACNRDLGRYFEAWGIPISKGAREKTAHLEVWLPSNIKAFQKFGQTR